MNRLKKEARAEALARRDAVPLGDRAARSAAICEELECVLSSGLAEGAGCAHAAEAEDAVQAVFLKLVDRPRPFADEEHEKAWLIVCAGNLCKDILKSPRHARRAALPDDMADNLPDERPGIGGEGDDVREAVLALPAKYKQCVYLYYYEGYRTAEIAAMTGTPASTVRSHLSEARALLRKTLGGESHGR